MRNTWKVILGLTLALGLRATLAQAQPLISGNTAAFGCGPIYTSDFTLGTVTHQFYPDGAGGTNCPTPVNQHNGRGVAIGGTEIFYTELDELIGPFPGFGATQFIHVANFNAGAGSPDTRAPINNPRPGTGIQDLTFASGILYALTGYDTQPPWVYGMNLSTGAVLSGPVPVGFPASPDSDGFAIMPDTGNLLVNNGGTSCIYSQYNPITGAFVAGSTMTVPGNVARCTGVDTDGTSLFFMTDFNSIVRTDLHGVINGFNFFNGPDAEIFIEDISLIHPVTSVIGVGDGHFFITLRDTNDIVSAHDFLAELLKNGTVVATGLTRCYPVSKRNFIPNPPGAHNVPIPISLPAAVPIVSGDVLSLRLSTRMGTNSDDTRCSIGHISNNGGLRLGYDATITPSQFAMTIFPTPSPQTFYLHSDGTFCTNVLGESQPTATLNRTLSDVAPVVATPRCKEAPGNIQFAGGNVWHLFSTWFLAAQP